jgi:hypothetical protein
MLKAFEMTSERRLKLYWEDDQGSSVGQYDEIPTSTILQFPTPIGADITRALIAHGWTLRQDADGTVWYRGEDQPEVDEMIGTTTRSSVALKILCAMVANGNYRMSEVCDKAFDLAERFLARVRRNGG